MSAIAPQNTDTPTSNGSSSRPPRDGLVRAMFPGAELRETSDGANPTMVGHFSVFNEWTEIKSAYEGHFLERIAPGAFKKTFQENGNSIKALFQHGRDPQIGDKPIGSIEMLEEDEQGAAYRVSLLKADYVMNSLLPGIRAGLYGSSFRFGAVREDFDQNPGVSDYNPLGLPERTIREARVAEFGPVTFPAYEGATANVRSMTDEFLFERLTHDRERLRELIRFVSLDKSLESSREDEQDLEELPEDNSDQAQEPELAEEPAEEQEVPQENSAPPESSAETESHPARGRRDHTKTMATFRTRKAQKPPWLLGQKGRKDDYRGTTGTRGRA